MSFIHKLRTYKEFTIKHFYGKNLASIFDEFNLDDSFSCVFKESLQV